MMIRTNFHTSNKSIIENVKITVRDANNIIIAASGEKSDWIQPAAASGVEDDVRARFNETIVKHPHTAIITAMFNNDLQDEEVLEYSAKEYIDYLKNVLAIIWDNIEITEDFDVDTLES